VGLEWGHSIEGPRQRRGLFLVITDSIGAPAPARSAPENENCTRYSYFYLLVIKRFINYRLRPDLITVPGTVFIRFPQICMASIPEEEGLHWNVMKFWYPDLHLATDAEIAAVGVAKSLKSKDLSEPLDCQRFPDLSASTIIPISKVGSIPPSSFDYGGVPPSLRTKGTPALWIFTAVPTPAHSALEYRSAHSAADPPREHPA